MNKPMFGLSRSPSWSDSQAAAAEGRADPRISAGGLPAKVVSPAGEYLCRLRDVSRSGVSLHLFHPLPLREGLSVETASGERFRLEWVWEGGGRGGFRFAGPASVLHLMGLASDYADRPVRVNLEAACRLVDLERGMGADGIVCNISTHGALVRGSRLQSVGQGVQVALGALPPMPALVRWKTGEYCGISFDEPFQFDVLALVVHELQAPLRKSTLPAALR